MTDPTNKLEPCPFCGDEAYFEHMGTIRRSCIVACRNCGARHESSDEYGHSGSSWNRRAASAPAAESVPTWDSLFDGSNAHLLPGVPSDEDNESTPKGDGDE